MDALPQLTLATPTFLHPTRRQSGLTPASITDSALAELTPTGAAWFFPAPTNGTYEPARLASALCTTLSAYPQLCGALTLLPPSGSVRFPDHTRRFGRVWVQWGDHEPGLMLTQARWRGPMADVLPRAHTDAALASAVMPNMFALVRLRPSALGPAMAGPSTVAQITTFACGGIAVALAAQHALADAQALAYVLRDWGAAYASLVRGENPTPAVRPYLPMMVDGLAHADVPDDALETLAQTVPQLRLDFWAYDPANPADTAPGWFTRSRAPPAEVDAHDAEQGRTRGTRAPFETWDADASVGDAVIDLSAENVERMFRAARGGASRLDAVLGTLWCAVVCARAELEPDAAVHLHSCVGLRRRLSPPLLDDFQGAPLINVSARMSVRELCQGGEGGASGAARAIRAAVDSVTPTTAAAVLHHMAHALDPAREWNAFVGSRHILTTSWLGIGAYAADFGHGPPVRVHPFMPPVDGIVVVMEAPGAGVQHGARSGVSLRILLRQDVLGRVLADPGLMG